MIPFYIYYSMFGLSPSGPLAFDPMPWYYGPVSRVELDGHVYSAIDLRDGRCVRLRQGDYARVSVARRWVELGADRSHLVDLDGAKAGRPRTGPVIRRIAEGGGRSLPSRRRSAGPTRGGGRSAGGRGGASSKTGLKVDCSPGVSSAAASIVVRKTGSPTGIFGGRPFPSTSGASGVPRDSRFGAVTDRPRRTLFGPRADCIMLVRLTAWSLPTSGSDHPCKCQRHATAKAAEIETLSP